MPRLVAVDAGPVVALFSKNDVNHATAVQFFRSFRDHGFITVPVITEVMYLLNFRLDAQLGFLRWLRQGALSVFDLANGDWERIVALTWKYADVPMDFGDSSLVAICEREGTRLIATVDSDFDVYRLSDRHAFQNVFWNSSSQ
jgi:predicted nucleic acid-binding protein